MRSRCALGLLAANLCLAVSFARSESEMGFEFAPKDHFVRQIESVDRPAITMVYPKTVDAGDLERFVLEALEAAEAKLGVRQRSSVSVLFDFRPEFHNGLTTVVPNPRVFVHLEAPVLLSSVGVSSHYLRETLIHEFAHLLVMEQAEGVFRPLNWVVGTAARPLGAWPRWLHEGLAVWVEGASGGRPSSGILDLEFRKFADFFHRRGRMPIRNSDLDGRLGLSAVSAGEIPYHIGYFLIEQWTKMQRVGGKSDAEIWSAQIQESARSLGLSFRKSFDRPAGNWDLAWKNWLAQVRAVPRPEALPPFVELDSATEVRGPELVGETLSWLTGTGADAQLCRLNSVKESKACWRWGRRDASVMGHWSLGAEGLSLVAFVQTASLVEGAWIHGQQTSVKNLGLFDGQSRMRCRLADLGRVRELFVSQPTGVEAQWDLLWVQSRTDGTQKLWSRRFDSQCQSQGADRLLAESRRAFERLSLPVFWNGVPSWTQSRGPELESEEMFLGSRVFRAQGRTLSRAQPLAGKEFLVQEQAPDFWGPAVWSSESNSLRRFPMPTGSVSSLWWASQKSFVVLSSHWEEDRLLVFEESQFRNRLGSPQSVSQEVTNSKVGSEPGVVTDTPTDKPKSSETEPTVYKAWPSLLPHFWIPSLFVSSGRVSVLGQTFADDLLGVWNSSLDVGYDGFLRSPLGAFDLSRSIGAVINRVGVGATLAPTYNFFPFGRDLSQERWGVHLDAQAAWVSKSLQLRWILSPQLSYTRASASGFLGAFEYWIPALKIQASSLSYQDTLAGPTLLSRASAGFQGSVLSRWIRGAELRARGVGQGSYRSIGMRTEVSAFWTQKANFPASYAEWGGGPILSTGTSFELSRGFSERAGLGLELARAAIQVAAPLSTRHRAFSWNRLRLGGTDLRFVTESVTFRSLGESPRFRFGESWFTSSGAEWDLAFHMLHYIRGRVALGLFRGWGSFGETRAQLSLRTGLDLP
jgi:hypothetical protein